MKNTVSWAPALAAALSLLASAAQAQEATGDWHGVLKVGPSELRLGLTVTAGPDGAMTGQLISPDQGGPPIPISEVRGGTASCPLPRRPSAAALTEYGTPRNRPGSDRGAKAPPSP